ncbi:MAG: CoA-transferase subunit beta [Symbiobacteriaceae bacterium]|nr:CoA-transferase subunit beta [Symbiobacteriaceae bacterium]
MTDSYDAYLQRHELKPNEFTYMEMLSVAVSRELADGDFAFVGTGTPLLAAGLAQRSHAKTMTIILEAGTVGPTIAHMPISVADPRAAYQATTLSSLVDAFGTIAARGYCTVGILGAAECDMYANLNSTALGSYWPAGVSEDGRGPHTRFTGSGGANSIAALADKIIVMMVHERRRFPRKVQYLTTIAGMRGPAGETRFDYGLYRGGDVVVISDLCKMRPDPQTGILYATELFPGVSAEMVQEATGWEVDLSRAVPGGVPTEEELRILRMEVDPARIYLNREKKG